MQCSSIGSLGQTPDVWLEGELARYAHKFHRCCAQTESSADIQRIQVSSVSTFQDF